MLDKIRILDIVDIAIVSSIIYAAYTLFKRTRSARIFAGLLAIGLTYLLAHQFKLYLTTFILRAFFAVIIIAMIVLFQEEIKRLFEKLGNHKLFKWIGNTEKSTLSSVEIRIQAIVDTVSDLAAKKIGGLIVIEGNDDVLSLESGSIILNGQLSGSIIKSIFDPHSQGHDGAVIISEDKILSFASHLPLSKNSKKLADLGTRHAAGLGISERTDAISIIVSEERGLVSVAKNDELNMLESPLQLTEYLREFYESNSKVMSNIGIAGIFTKNIYPKALSICIAIILWIFLVIYSSGD